MAPRARGLETPIGRDALVERLLAEIDEARHGGDRRLVALAGPPGVGKSTRAAWLRDRIEERAPGAVAVLGMDGFHLDDRLLEGRGWRARKGAPHTFDVAGLAALLERLARDDEDEIIAPEFDRAIEVARAGAVAIPRAARLVLVEGNYLLLDQAPWRSLREVFHLAVRLDASLETLRGRLTERWRDQGLSDAAALEKIEENDLPNARLVLEESAVADFVLSS